LTYFPARERKTRPLARTPRKRVLASLFRFGRENLEEWKNVLRDLVERGLRRVLLRVHDDFSGLRPITRSFLPQADVQLGIVHLQRNTKSPFTKTDAAEFNQRICALKSTWNAEVAATPRSRTSASILNPAPSASFGRSVKSQIITSLSSTHIYPDSLRRSLSTTHAVEAVNGQLEILRRHSGGSFHSEDTLKLQLGLAVSPLETGRWRRVAASVQNALDQFNAIFPSRFESEE
jgi:putative transposase